MNMDNQSLSSSRVPVGVLGGSGYTGLEVMRVLRGHDGVEVRFATSDSEAGNPTPIPGLAFTPVAQARLDLKKVAGDLGITNGFVATNGKEIEELRRRGERNIVEFHVNKTKDFQKIGDIAVEIGRAHV